MAEEINMTDQPQDAVAQLEDLRARIFRGEEPTPEEYEKVLTQLRQARRAGARGAKAERKKTGASTSTVEKMSEAQLDEALKNF